MSKTPKADQVKGLREQRAARWEAAARRHEAEARAIGDHREWSAQDDRDAHMAAARRLRAKAKRAKKGKRK